MLVYHKEGPLLYLLCGFLTLEQTTTGTFADDILASHKDPKKVSRKLQEYIIEIQKCWRIKINEQNLCTSHSH